MGYDELKTYIEKRSPKTLIGYHIDKLFRKDFSFGDLCNDVLALVKYDSKLAQRREVLKNLEQLHKTNDTQNRVNVLRGSNWLAKHKDPVYSAIYRKNTGLGADFDIFIDPVGVGEDHNLMSKISNRVMSELEYVTLQDNIQRVEQERAEEARAILSLFGA